MIPQEKQPNDVSMLKVAGAERRKDRQTETERDQHVFADASKYSSVNYNFYP